jgi:alkylation response protein AidB-like acyl-CoA dehydrogenase
VDFSFGDEQEHVRELARTVLDKEVDAARLRAAEQSADGIDDALWARLADTNLLGIAIPEEHGGLGFGFLELCALLEEVGRAVAPVPALATLVLGALPLAAFGTPAQRARWLPEIAAGRALLSAALLETGFADPRRCATQARPDASGWSLHGEKRDVPCARRAARVLVPAATPEGVAIFLVDPAARGVELVAGRRSTGEPSFSLRLSGVRVAAEERLGGVDVDGGAALAWIQERALVATAAVQTGVAERALRMTAAYAGERVQFGVPIGSFQAVQHRCADAFIDVEALRWCSWRAAWRLAQGLPAAREAAVAKFWAAEAGARVANAALHLHGGLGSDVDYPIQRYFLWSRALGLELGGAEPQLAWLGKDMARTGPEEQA